MDSPRYLQPFPHAVAGMHLGRMTPMPLVGEFDAVLSVGADEGLVENGLRHKHLHLPYGPEIDVPRLNQAVAWVLAQVNADRRVLIRSEGGRQRPALVVAMVVVHLGGHVHDGIDAVVHADIGALSDFRYLRVLRAEAVKIHRA